MSSVLKSFPSVPPILGMALASKPAQVLVPSILTHIWATKFIQCGPYVHGFRDDLLELDYLVGGSFLENDSSSLSSHSLPSSSSRGGPCETPQMSHQQVSSLCRFCFGNHIVESSCMRHPYHVYSKLSGPRALTNFPSFFSDVSEPQVQGWPSNWGGGRKVTQRERKEGQRNNTKHISLFNLRGSTCPLGRKSKANTSQNYIEI